MKLLLKLLTLPLLLLCFLTQAQVTTNFNNQTPIDAKGKFIKPYKVKTDFEVAAKDISSLLLAEKKKNDSTSKTQVFKFAVPVTVDLNIARLMDWQYKDGSAYGKFTIRLNGALSSSINFDKFYLPEATEMYIYNENGNMITGPVTERENNPNKMWGSWVYQGSWLTIEMKTPSSTVNQLILHANNIAYGYKKVYQVGGFGQSASCEINVLCPLGNGWQNERNSVALGISGDGTGAFSGSMIMNTCGTNTPYFLTANHVYQQATPVRDVTGWRFTFQAWSPTCTPSQNSNGVTYNGSAFRANWAGSDFCLVQLNTIPPSSSGINYAGWSRNTAGITQTTIIHHPAADVMKITNDVNAPAFGNFGGAQCWHLIVDNGTTEGGSSGSPYFDQNHRIIAQHYGIDDNNLAICKQVSKYGGRFDVSWMGGGTSATRLSSWLDPNNTNAVTTNTTNVNALIPYSSGIVGTTIICNTSDYSISNLPAGATVIWSIPQSAGSTLQLAQNTPATNQLRITNQKFYQVTTTLTATISNIGCGAPTQTITKTIKNDNSTSASAPFQYYQEACTFYNVSHPSMTGTTYSNSNPLFVHQGCTVYVNLGDMTGRTITLAPGSGQPVYWTVGATSYYPNTLSFQLPYGSGGTPFTFNINDDGSCYQKSLLFFSQTGNGKIIYAIYPNPVNTTLEVDLDKSNKEVPSNAEIQEVQLINKMGAMKYQKRFGKGLSHVNISVAQLTNDVYSLRIFDGKTWNSQKVIVQH